MPLAEIISQSTDLDMRNNKYLQSFFTKKSLLLRNKLSNIEDRQFSVGQFI